MVRQTMQGTDSGMWEKSSLLERYLFSAGDETGGACRHTRSTGMSDAILGVNQMVHSRDLNNPRQPKKNQATQTCAGARPDGSGCGDHGR